MFSIVEKSENIDKELSLYEDNVKQYFIDNFNSTKNIVDKIVIKFDERHKKVFYDKYVGIVWNNEDYSDMKKNSKEYKKCQKIIEKTKGKIRLANTEFIEKGQGLTTKKLDNTGEKWTCQTCLLENSQKDQQCIACGENRT